MKRLLLIWMLMVLAMPTSGLADEVGGSYSGPETTQAMEAFVRNVALVDDRLSMPAVAKRN